MALFSAKPNFSAEANKVSSERKASFKAMSTGIMTTSGGKQTGFSLVELAIVLIIIGLIVGGVLKGQDLIESARVNSIQTQLNEIRTAATTFLNKFDDLPGDIPDPELLPASADSDGDGNGRIDGDGDRIGVDPTAGTTAGDNEPTAFWYHLIVAELIAGIDSSCSETGGIVTCEFGGTGDASLDPADALQSRVDGFFTVKWDEIEDGSDFTSIENHWIVLGNGDDADGNNYEPVLTPIQLRTIDQRGDDGRPESGSIIGFGDNGETTPVNCRNTDAGENSYTADDLAIACVGAFRL